MSFPYDFIFVFIQYFNGTILLEKSFVKWGKGGGVRRNTKREDDYIGRRLLIEGGIQTSCTLC